MFICLLFICLGATTPALGIEAASFFVFLKKDTAESPTL